MTPPTHQQRPLRFRAWTLGTKEMVHSKENADVGFWKHVAYDSNTIVMQSTGLRDVKGVEIFEGDIVQIRNSPVGEMMKETRGIDPHNEEVWWDSERGMWYFKMCAPMSYEESDWKEWEVIGNVWENPELLSTTK